MNITATQVIEQAREVAAAHPERKASRQRDGLGSVYRMEGEPFCLFGHALDRLGLLELMPEGYDELRISSVLSLMQVTGTYAELEWLSNAQSNQDIGMTWSKSVSHADHYTPINEKEH